MVTVRFGILATPDHGTAEARSSFEIHVIRWFRAGKRAPNAVHRLYRDRHGGLATTAPGWHDGGSSPLPSRPPVDSFASLALMAGTAFAAATLLPAQSEAVFLALLAAGSVAPWVLFTVASLANTAGSVLNWWLGRLIARGGLEVLSPRLRPDPAKLARAQGWFKRFGWPSLLFAWLPFGGDPLTLVAGTLNYPLGRFVMLVLLGKAARYAALWAGWSAL